MATRPCGPTSQRTAARRAALSISGDLPPVHGRGSVRCSHALFTCAVRNTGGTNGPNGAWCPAVAAATVDWTGAPVLEGRLWVTGVVQSPWLCCSCSRAARRMELVIGPTRRANGRVPVGVWPNPRHGTVGAPAAARSTVPRTPGHGPREPRVEDETDRRPGVRVAVRRVARGRSIAGLPPAHRSGENPHRLRAGTRPRPTLPPGRAGDDPRATRPGRVREAPGRLRAVGRTALERETRRVPSSITGGLPTLHAGGQCGLRRVAGAHPAG